MMSQNIRATGRSLGRQGISWKVLGSGRAIMSLSSMRANPSIEDPSNPMPSAMPSSSSEGVTLKDFSFPRTSVNQN